MTLTKLKMEREYDVVLFRRSGDIQYSSTAAQLLAQVADHNASHKGDSIVLVHSLFEPDTGTTTHINTIAGVYGSEKEA
jgi:uncharacterized damage-inducible protein DinB